MHAVVHRVRFTKWFQFYVGQVYLYLFIEMLVSIARRFCTHMKTCTVIIICTDEKRLPKQLLLFKLCVDLEGDMSLKVKGTLNMPRMQINQLFVGD